MTYDYIYAAACLFSHPQHASVAISHCQELSKHLAAFSFSSRSIGAKISESKVGPSFLSCECGAQLRNTRGPGGENTFVLVKARV